MAKVKVQQDEPSFYRVIKGCNTSDETRYEASTDENPVFMSDADVSCDDIVELLLMGAIEECQ